MKKLSLHFFLVTLLFIVGCPKKPIALPPEISKSFVMLNLSSIEDQYFIDMATNAESKMAFLKAKTLIIIYPLGEFVSNRAPVDSRKTLTFVEQPTKSFLLSQK